MASLALATLLLSLSFLCSRVSIAAVQVMEDRFPVKKMNYPVKVSKESYGNSRISMAELKMRRFAGRKLMLKSAEAAIMADNIHEGESKRRAEKDLSDSNQQFFGISPHPFQKQGYFSVNMFGEKSFKYHMNFPNKLGQHLKDSSPAPEESVVIDDELRNFMSQDYSGKDPHEKAPIHN